MTEPQGAPVRIMRGQPDDVELAALLAGLVATQGAAEDDAGAASARWADPARRVRGVVARRPGADAWRWSFHD